MNTHSIYNKYRYTIMLICSVSLFLSCTQDEELEQQTENNRQYMHELVKRMNMAIYEDVSFEPATKATLTCAKPVNVKVVLPADNAGLILDVPEVKSASTMHDLQCIVRDYGADLVVVENPINSDRIVQLSEPKIIETLSPMVKESRDYLYSIGLTDNDISEMLEEAGADESSLIPFTLLLVEHDSKYYADLINTTQWSLIPSAYAATWDDAKNCAIQAVGADIIVNFGASAAKTWSKAVIKRLFKEVAKRIIGPAGVVIAVVEFGVCMHG